MGNMTKITDRIRQSADAEVEKIRADAAAQIAALVADTKAKTDALTAENHALIAKEIAEADERTASAVESAKRSISLSAKSQALETVYAHVRKALAALDGDAREKFLCGVLRTALSDCHSREADAKATFGEDIAPDGYEIRLSAADTAAFGETLVKIGKSYFGDTITLGEPAAIEGGLILRAGDALCNCSLDMILADARAKTEADVCQTLFGR